MSPVVRKSDVISEKRQTVDTVGWQIRVAPYAWSPPTDVYEIEDSYIVRVEVAGMRQTDFQVNIDGKNLMISGVRPDVLGRRAYQQMEIRFGEFHTAVQFSGYIDADNTEAVYEDGFLTVTLPKAKPRSIKIKE